MFYDDEDDGYVEYKKIENRADYKRSKQTNQNTQEVKMNAV